PASSSAPLPTTTSAFNDAAPTGIYPLSLHDALPIFTRSRVPGGPLRSTRPPAAITLSRIPLRPEPSGSLAPTPSSATSRTTSPGDRKSTRLNSSHVKISYAVFCLKKKNKRTRQQQDA